MPGITSRRCGSCSSRSEPDDYVIATGETHSVREFAEKVFAKLDLDYQKHVEIDPRYFRPTEVDVLLGDAAKARKVLGWQPKVGFEELIDMMVAADLEIAEKEKTLGNAGFACEPKRSCPEPSRKLVMEKDAKIYVAGHSGMVGTAIVRDAEGAGIRQPAAAHPLGARPSPPGTSVEAFFERERPQVVILAAARVGGIWANLNNPAPFFYDNMMIQLNVVHAAWRFGTQRLLFVSSSCSYPRMSPQPMKEEAILTGPPEPTNEYYAIAKISGMKMIEAYHRQHGVQFFSVIFPNLFGPGDNFDLGDSHVIAALIRRFHEAAAGNLPRLKSGGPAGPDGNSSTSRTRPTPACSSSTGSRAARP